MLANYHEQPFDIEKGNPTFKEIYEEWSATKYRDASRSTINGYRAAYNCCIKLYERPIRELKTKDLQDIIDTCGKNIPTLRNIKILFSQLYDYAMKNDIVVKNYAKYVSLDKHKDENPNAFDRVPFTKEQIDVLWQFKNNPYYMMILIMIYTGLRVSELLDLKKEDVNMEEHYFKVVESKTEAGIRKVPIGTYIYPLFKFWYDSYKDCEYVFHSKSGEKFLYRNYYDSYFCPLMLQHCFSQTPHCCRHTFISLLAEANVSPTYTKLIVGHKGAMSITESVYTHIDMNLLIDAVDSVYYPKSIKS